ncbi:MAG: methionyl-tRNA formyltransferase [Beijerinckiaceae bacterium]|nr:methionyl-tRNA formyltransferase [Beijerinckiaceae bacterium]
MALRIVFMGTPDFSVPTLHAIIKAGHDVVACYTRAPKAAGRRGLSLTKSPVHELADTCGIPVFTPRTLRDEAEIAHFAGHNADVGVVVAYGLILPKPVLDAPRYGCLNLHGSLLPRWRGAAPIQRAVMAGDLQTGVMVMRMEEGLDTGPVAMTHRTAIGADMTAGELHDELSPAGAALAVEALVALERGELVFTPQPAEGVVYAHKIEKAEARLDWSAPATRVHNRIRGLSPFPGAWFEADFGRGVERVKVLRSTLAQGSGAPGSVSGDDLVVACGDGAVRLLHVQRAGGKAVSAAEFARGIVSMPASFS